MKVVKKMPVPIYESTCPECKSVFRYKKAEVSLLQITCPVCGVSMWAETIPVEEDRGQDDDFGPTETIPDADGWEHILIGGTK